jgi:hypothetical protein
MQIIRGYLRRIVLVPVASGAAFARRDFPAASSAAKPADTGGRSARLGGGR